MTNHKPEHKKILAKALQTSWEKARQSFASGMGFEIRAGQLRMIQMIEENLELTRTDAHEEKPCHVSIIEAPTGTGKTFGYLVPAMPYIAFSRGVKAIIATANKSLQHQIFEKDIPVIRKLLNDCGHLRVAMPKGRDNFLCKEKIDTEMLAMGKAKEMVIVKAVKKVKKTKDGKEQKLESKLNDHDKEMVTGLYMRFFKPGSAKHWDGDFDSLNVSDISKQRAKELLGADRHSCIGKNCPSFRECVYYKNRTEWEQADVLVTNQAWVMANLASGSRMIDPKKTVFIMDEAHHLPAMAVAAFKKEFSHRSMLGLPSFKPMLDTMVDIPSQIYDRIAALGMFREFSKNSMENFGESMTEQVKKLSVFVNRFVDGRLGSSNERQSLLIETDDCIDGSEFSKLLTNADNVAKCYMDNLVPIMEVLEQTFGEPSFKHDMEKEGVDIGTMIKWRGQLSRKIESFAKFRDVIYGFKMANVLTPDHSPTAKIIVRDDRGWHFEISHTLADRILPVLLFDDAHSVILTSATISSGNKSGNGFSNYMKQTGLEKHETPVVCESMASPFDFTKSVFAELVLDSVPKGDSSLDFEREVARVIPTAIKASNRKGTLVLLTSLRSMENLRKNLPADILKDCKFQKDGGLQHLIRQHKEDIDAGRRSILIGVQSLAEGLDLPRKWCENVFIVRLPFAPPDDPVKRLLEHWYSKIVGKNYFRDFVLPETAIILAQQIGRLIRTMDDQGFVMVLDKRLWENKSFSLLRNAIPNFERVRITHTNAETELRKVSDRIFNHQ